jgi:uncharacterized protein YlbG (UPF0298 family)
VTTIISTVLVIALASNTPAQTNLSQETQKESDLIIFDNYTILLDSPPFLSKMPWQQEKPEYLWTCFSIRTKPEINQMIKVNIAANGLGQTEFASTDQLSSCEMFRGSGGGWTDKVLNWSPFLDLEINFIDPRSNKFSQGTKVVAIRIPVDLVPQPGRSIEGKIMVIEPNRKSSELPLKIEMSASNSISTSPIFTVLQWFIGIAIPAWLTYRLGMAAAQEKTRSDSKAQEWREFNAFKEQNREKLRKFFYYDYSRITKPDSEPAVLSEKEIIDHLRSELEKEDFLKSIPRSERKALEKAFNGKKLNKVENKLVDLFDEWRSYIKPKSFF